MNKEKTQDFLRLMITVDIKNKNVRVFLLLRSEQKMIVKENSTQKQLGFSWWRSG